MLIVVYALAIPLYVLLTFAAPTTDNRFQLSATSTLLLQATFIVPIVLIWLQGVSGAVAFKAYVQQRSRGTETKALDTVATGVMILLTGLIVTSVYGALRPYAIEAGNVQAFQISRNYLSIFFQLLGTVIVFRGSRQLLGACSIFPLSRRSLGILGAIIGVVMTGLLVLLYQDPYRNDSPDPGRYSSFFLPDSLIILTILAPYAVNWFIGLVGAINIRRYSRNIRNDYRQRAYSRLSLGIASIIGVTILLQLLTILTPVVAELSLGALLLVYYILVLFYGLGYFLIASGARKLEKGARR